MRAGIRWVVLSVACHVLVWSWPAPARPSETPGSPEAPKGPSETPAEAPSAVVQEAPLPVYLKDDETGKLVPWLGMTIQDAEQLYERAEGNKEPEQVPRYVIQSMIATGSADAARARLSIEFKIRVRDENWTRVPLRLNDAVLAAEGDQYVGPGEYFPHYDEQGEGYVAWIRGDPKQVHSLTLTVWLGLASVGEQKRLRLSVPRAASSKLTFTVAEPGAEGKVPDGASLDTPSPSESGGTKFTAGNFSGDFELTWHRSDTRRPPVRPVLEVNGGIVAQVEGDVVTTEATLQVTSEGAPFDRFLVRLPRGATWIPEVPRGYAVVKVPDPDGGDGRAVVEVQRAEKSTAPMEVQLSAEQSFEAAGPGGSLELAAFEVIDAARHSGCVAVTRVGKGHVWCVPGRGVGQIDQLPEALQKKVQNAQVVGRFEYYRQPFLLAAEVVEIESSRCVEPEYWILVEPDQVVLEGKLRYTVLGTEVDELSVGLAQWQVNKEDVGPDNVVNVERIRLDGSGTLRIPLLKSLKGPVEVSIRASYAIPPDCRLLKLRLPRPQAELVRPADTVIQPADSVRLIPRDGQKAGLTRQQVAPPSPPPERGSWQQGPLYYRTDTAAAAFEADFQVLPQEVAVDVMTAIDLMEGQAEVWQTVVYRIAHEPLEKLAIRVPETLAASDTLEFLLDDQPVTPILDPADPGDGSGQARQWVVLPAAQIGTCRLEARYTVPMDGLLSKSRIDATVPLVTPDDKVGKAELGNNELSVTAPEGVSIQIPEGPWSLVDRMAEGAPTTTRWSFSADGVAKEALLRIHEEDSRAAVVERAWIQTWLTSTARRDRAVFRFTSKRSQLELTLPAGVDLGTLRAFAGPESPEDRRRVKPEIVSETRLVIDLSGDSGSRPQWLEVLYDVLGPRPAPGRLSVDLPHLGSDASVHHVYWQLVLPRNEHVVGTAEGLTPEFAWGWNGAFWGRNPILEQPQLERWAGAVPRTRLPEATSRYLFSSLGPVERLELRTAERWWIVLVASLGVLTGGLLLIYVPGLRHPAVLLAAAVIIAGVGLVYTEPVLLAAEAASLGLALALLAGLLHRTLARERHWVVRPEVASSVIHRGSTQAQYRPPEAGTPASTQAAPSPVPTTPTSGPGP